MTTGSATKTSIVSSPFLSISFSSKENVTLGRKIDGLGGEHFFVSFADNTNRSLCITYSLLGVNPNSDIAANIALL